jgi:hypothetical protein
MEVFYGMINTPKYVLLIMEADTIQKLQAIFEQAEGSKEP